jgi:hypothetical protein
VSRHYAWRGDTLVRLPQIRVHPYTPSWVAARLRRAERRAALSLTEQHRDQAGFIIKAGVGGGTTMYDPGEIDRYLWVQANGTED